MANFLDKLFSGDKKRLAAIEAKAKEVDALKDQMAALSDEELKGKTVEFKERIANGETLDEILVEAFAVSREAAKRVIGEFPYLVQIMGAIVMQGGDIAEMKTGEGKTLTSTMAVYLNALSGKGVHVITVNEYLADRDANWMGQIYKFLDLSVGINARSLTPAQKRAAYNCDITYTTNSEIGFDYLRDNMVTDVKDRVLRPLNIAIVDEVDSILIDESRTPLIISGGAKRTKNLYLDADRFAKSLNTEDYEIDEKTKAIQLTESGVERAEKKFKLNNLYDLEHTQLVHHIQQALRANYIMGLDKEYVVQDDEIVIVDQFTGRLMKGRAYSDGLHQAIEAKEGVTIKEETSTLATITYQNFFRLYDKLAGMTGTAKTEEEEFLSIYNMRVIEIPTNRPVAREDYPDAIYGTMKSKFNALVEEIMELNAKGQPVLVGTIAVETSELVSKMLKSRHIRHEVLNAKNHAREAEIIAKAGRPHAVTIATNMAGRGTDIKLTEESRALGGLAVLGSERHESRRIDNQLRGRSGRQGDPGYSRFYVSLEDELMVRFGGEKVKGLFSKLGDDSQIESKAITKSISVAQKRVEGNNFDIRKQLLEYDDVLRQQREIMYSQRNFVLENEDVHGIVKDMFDRIITSIVNQNIEHNGRNEEINPDSLLQGFDLIGLPENVLNKEMIEDKEVNEVKEICYETVLGYYETKLANAKKDFGTFMRTEAIKRKQSVSNEEIEERFKKAILPLEKNIVLKNMDRNWIEHIDMMSKLRDGIHLRSYAQNNPLQAYVEEGYEMFEEMMGRIAREVVFFCMKVEFK